MQPLERELSSSQTSSTTTVPAPVSPRFAPFRMPLRRRLQTLAVLWHTVSISFSLAMFFLFCSMPQLWPLIIMYMIWLSMDDSPETGRLKMRPWVRNLRVFRWFCQYFPIRLHRTKELDPGQKYVFGYHPHGIISVGAFGAFGTEGAGFSQLFPGINMSVLTIASNFNIPMYRDYMLSLGIMSVSKQSCESILRNGPGSALLIVVGGAAESLSARPGTSDLVLSKRKGFIKLAIRNGAHLVPCFAFGENEVYQQLDNNPDTKLYKFQSFFKKVAGFTPPLFHGRGALNYDFGLLPWRKPINVVVGKPIPVSQSDQPSQEEIENIQKQYVEELTSIWDEWKDTYASDRIKEMTIVQ